MFYVGWLDGLLGIAGMMKLIVASGSFPKSPCVKRTSQSIQALWSLWWKQETSTFAKTYGETQSIYPAYHM